MSQPVPGAVLLVLAKAPVAGRAKTRLCPPATARGAARLAAAALLDTLDAVLAVPDAVAMIALTGELADAERAAELADTLAGVTRFDQCAGGLGTRIAHAHVQAAARAPGSVVLQIGMDTPQLDPATMNEALAALRAPGGPDAVLGPASDGGWWALGLRDPNASALIADVPTSRADTGERTLAALRAAGLTVQPLVEMLDVDTARDALEVASSGRAGRRFTAEVAAVLGDPASGRTLGMERPR
jgi:hypothetical protein